MKNNNDNKNNIIEKNKKKYPVLKYLGIGILLVCIPLFVSILILNLGNVLPIINQKMANVSNLLCKIPIYDYYTQYLQGYLYYDNYKYAIDKGFILSGEINSKWVDFYFKIFFESLPLFIILFISVIPKYTIPQLKYYQNKKERKKLINILEKTPAYKKDEIIKNSGKLASLYLNETFKNYQKQKQCSTPEKNLIEMIVSSGTVNIDKKAKIDKDSLSRMKPYLENMLYSNLILIENNIDKYINEETNFFVNKLNGKIQNRELYFTSLGKEVSVDELKKYYYYVYLFYLSKQFTNFEMYQYSENLDVPIEIKKLCKWSSSSNCPDVFFITLNKDEIMCELYYRKYRMMKYMGLEYEYLNKYLIEIEKTRRIERVKVEKDKVS